MPDGEPNYEHDYFAAVAKVQAMFAYAPTPGEVVRAIERLGWAPREFVTAQVVAPILALHTRGEVYAPPGEGLVTTDDDLIADACQYCAVDWPCQTVTACGSSVPKGES